MNPKTPIQGIPTVPFYTENGQNYAANTGGTVDMTIDGGRLGTEPPLNLAPTITPTGHSGLGLYASTVSANTKTALEKQDEDKGSKEKAEMEGGKSAYAKTVEAIKGFSGRKEEINQEEKVDENRMAVDEYTSQIEAEEIALNRKIEEIERNSEGKFAGAINDEVRRVTRESARFTADLAIKQSVALRKYDTARSIADRRIDAELEPLKIQLEADKFFYQENKEEFNKEEDRLMSARIRKEERELDDKRENAHRLEDMKFDIVKNSPDMPRAIREAVLAGTTVDEVIAAGGQFAVSQNQRLQNEKLQGEINNNKPISGEWSSVVNSTLSLVPGTSKSSVRQAIGQALANEDYEGAYAQIANAVEGVLTGTNKMTFADARTDIGVMTGLRDAIQQYTDAGGNVGFLKGTADQIAKNFGQLATDPKFASLAVQLEREFQAYRLAMTGAAFSPEESTEYRKVNPRSNATLDLNLATIDGALAQLTNRVTSTINSRVPEARNLQTKLTGTATSATNPTSNTGGRLNNEDAYAAYLNVKNGTTASKATGADGVYWKPKGTGAVDTSGKPIDLKSFFK